MTNFVSVFKNLFLNTAWQNDNTKMAALHKIQNIENVIKLNSNFFSGEGIHTKNRVLTQ